ncbi:MAG: amidohydrolase [Alcaligenaceae bacterium]|nr:amidohydrolase [Alcaligenaceae bacterium]
MKITKEMLEQVTAWRRHLHAHPELGFEEHHTSEFIAKTLSELGIEVHRGIAKTGVVGVLKRGTSARSIGLRADMDALPLVELGEVEYRSTHVGSMHACGHDGHTAMLLGAAKYLSQHGKFDGTVYFIFQPAEENLGGGRAMVEDGLFERFSIDQVYGMHNWPGRPLGDICVNDEAMMASFDIFDIELVGHGGHAAIPEKTRDPIVAAAELVQHLQSIISRRVSAHDAAVLSVTQISGGETYNIIPEKVQLKGTVRALNESVRLEVKQQLIKAVESLPLLREVKGSIDYQDGYPATINTPERAQKVRSIVAQVFGQERVFEGVLPSMASEDFSFMLREKAGAYIWLGVDDPSGEKPSAPLHNPYYDFNDDALEIGIRIWVSLVEQLGVTL